MRRSLPGALLLTLTLPFALALATHAQTTTTTTTAPLRYRVAFPAAVHHEARITLHLPPDAVPAAGPVVLRMARASPGRYALHEFAKNVYDVAATDAATGRPLPVGRPDPYGWHVLAPPGTAIRFSYTLFGDRSDGTYAAIDSEHAHLNLPATLVYAPALAGRPHEVRFDLPPGSRWTVATQLQPADADSTWWAPHLAYLLDSPVLLGEFRRRTWTQSGQQLELAVLSREGETGLDSLAAHAQRVTRTAEALWGGLPRFDYGRYVFLADYLPTVANDGMEHRNSTSLTTAALLSKGDDAHMGTLSHEFFHAWNVERLRPADLEPFDFDRANMSDALWLAEGFTLYYGDLILHRAGLLSDTAYARELTRLVQASEQPGAQRFSAVEMSRQAPFVDAARSVDPTNRANTYASYYPLGGALALALDLELRVRQHSLDELMRVLWRDFGSHQADATPQRPYRLPDVQRALAGVVADSVFAGEFFRAHVYGHASYAWEKLLAQVGLVVQPANATPWLGATSLEFSPQGALLSGSTLQQGPLYNAGLDRGDRLVRLGRRRLRSAAELRTALNAVKPGTAVEIEVSPRSGGPNRYLSLTLPPNPAREVHLRETARGPKNNASAPTDLQATMRQAWWGLPRR